MVNVSKYAVVEDNVCVNVIEADSIEIAQAATNKSCYLLKDAPQIADTQVPTEEQMLQIKEAAVGIGWIYDPVQNIFISPEL